MFSGNLILLLCSYVFVIIFIVVFIFRYALIMIRVAIDMHILFTKGRFIA